MPDPAPAPASEPAAAPAAPAPPAPAPPSPSSHSQLHTSPQMNDAFADLDKLMASEATAPPPAQPAGKTQETPADATQSDDTAAQTEALKPADDQPGKQPSKTASLRQAYETTKRRVAELELELKSIKSAKPPEDPEKKTLSERLAEREKRLADLEEKIRFSAFEQSDEYRDKYEKPFVDAYQYGRAKTATLKVAQEDGTTRQATAEDFDRIMQTADDDVAADLATEMFGNKDKLVLLWRDQVLQKNAARAQALDEYRKNGAERHRQAAEGAAKQREQMAKMWTQFNDEARTKYPQWFQPAEGDAEGNKLLEDGYKMADAAFAGANGMTPEQTVRLHSAIRNRAAAFGRLALQNKKLAGKIADLEKELKAFKESEPGAGEGGKGKEKAKFSSIMDEAESGLEKFVGR